MPLTIIDGEADPQAGMTLHDQATSINGQRIGDASMGGYYVSRRGGDSHVLTTGGAGPCAIIVVHAADGTGALGHFGGHDDPNAVVAAVADMLVHFGGKVVTDILFAAGEIDEHPGQHAFDAAIVAGAQALVPTATVHRRLQLHNGRSSSAAIYFPATGTIGLYDGLPGDLTGTAKDPDLTGHSYP